MKAIIFDFDGTLTVASQNVWKQVWQALGYDTGEGSYYRELYFKFVKGDITHKQWCDLTCEAFKKKGVKRELLTQLGEKIALHKGFEETVATLKREGYSLHIVSGNIGLVISGVVKDKAKYFDSINSNYFAFDGKGMLDSIKGTDYDFEGKAKFINEFKERYNISAKDITFVGNGDNDEWAHLSGCNTLCINPDKTDGDNKKIWHNSIKNLTDLRQILPILQKNHEHKADKEQM